MRGDGRRVAVMRAHSAAEAVDLYAAAGDALPFAGGTDLMVSWNAGQWRDRRVLDLSAVAAWSRIEETPEGLRIGALATHTAVRRHPAVAAAAPLLAAACATIGGIQIQNRGTVGGNIANASPAGDTFPALAVYDAVVHVVSAGGRRDIPFASIFAGVKKTVLGPGELIEAITLPAPRRPPDRHLFRKVGTRAAQAISKVVAAGQLWLAGDGSVEELRFALGSVAPTVKRARAVEESLRGQRLTPGAVQDAGAKLERDIAPIDDLRSTAKYRMRVAQALLAAFLGQEPG